MKDLYSFLPWNVLSNAFSDGRILNKKPNKQDQESGTAHSSSIRSRHPQGGDTLWYLDKSIHYKHRWIWKMAIWCHRWIFIMELYKLKTTQMLYHISRASQRSKEQQNWVSVISPKHFKADGHLKSREKKKLFTFPYLVHKAHLIVLILCIKKWEFHAAASQLHIWLLFCSCKTTLKNCEIRCDQPGINTSTHFVPSLWHAALFILVSRAMASVISSFYKQKSTNIFNSTEICKWPLSLARFKYEIQYPISRAFLPLCSYFQVAILVIWSKYPTQGTISQNNISVKHLKWDFDLLAPKPLLILL